MGVLWTIRSGSAGGWAFQASWTPIGPRRHATHVILRLGGEGRGCDLLSRAGLSRCRWFAMPMCTLRGVCWQPVCTLPLDRPPLTCVLECHLLWMLGLWAGGIQRKTTRGRFAVRRSHRTCPLNSQILVRTSSCFMWHGCTASASAEAAWAAAGIMCPATE